MDVVVGIVEAIGDFYIWIAPAFWPAAAVLFLGWMFKEVRAKRDARQVTSRMQRQEYIEWKKRYISGELTNSVPSDSDIDLNLRWFVVRRDKNPEQIIISNRGEMPASHVRVRLAGGKGKTKWRWRIRPGKSMRLKIGKVPDRSIDGLALDIHWDDKRLLAQKVSFVVPQSELELPKPAVSTKSTKDTRSGPAPVGKLASQSPPANTSTAVAQSATRSAPTPVASHKPSLPLPNSSPGTSLPTNGANSSTNIADRSIPNRTHGLPADFNVVPDNGQLFLQNLGPGDASHVYLQPLDDDQFIVGGGFWLSIPARKSEPFLISDPRDIGRHVVSFEVTWDDGFQLRRAAKVKIPAKDGLTDF